MGNDSKKEAVRELIRHAEYRTGQAQIEAILSLGGHLDDPKAVRELQLQIKIRTGEERIAALRALGGRTKL